MVIMQVAVSISVIMQAADADPCNYARSLWYTATRIITIFESTLQVASKNL
jgi:hypothetical protein